MKEVEVKGTEGGKLTIALRGDIDSGNSDAFYAEVIEAYRANPAASCSSAGNSISSIPRRWGRLSRF